MMRFMFKLYTSFGLTMLASPDSKVSHLLFFDVEGTFLIVVVDILHLIHCLWPILHEGSTYHIQHFEIKSDVAGLITCVGPLNKEEDNGFVH